MLKKLLIKLGLMKDPKAIIESLLKELDAVESAKKKKAPVKKTVAKKVAKKAPVKKAAAKKKAAKKAK
jgi:hypothetical protein